MSRLNRLSASAIRSMFSSETDESIIMLIEIEDPVTNTVSEMFATSDEVRLVNITNYNIDDNLIFSSTYGGLTAGRTYYVVNINYSTSRVQLSTTPRGSVVNITATGSVSNITAKRVIRIADSWLERLDYTTTDEVIYGVKSTVSGFERQFIFIPVEVQLPQESESGETSCRLVVNYVTSEMIELIRSSLNKPASTKIELVLSSSPNYVEAEFSNFFISNVSYNATQITFELNMISYSREPFPAFNFTPIYFPGLF